MRRLLQPTARLGRSAFIRHLSTEAKPKLPYEGVRIIEKANLLSGRLTGLMFADQGAEVLVIDPKEGEDVDSYLNRSKIGIKASDVSMSSADILIVDGSDDSIPRLPHQIMMRTVAALPGDTRFGHLADDIDEDYLSALTGFFTDMDMMGWLDRPVTYTLSSSAPSMRASSARTRARPPSSTSCGAARGREIHASRIAGGLSAIGAYASLRRASPPTSIPCPPSTSTLTISCRSARVLRRPSWRSTRRRRLPTRQSRHGSSSASIRLWRRTSVRMVSTFYRWPHSIGASPPATASTSVLRTRWRSLVSSIRTLTILPPCHSTTVT